MFQKELGKHFELKLFKNGHRTVYPLSPRRSVPSRIKRPDYADDPKGLNMEFDRIILPAAFSINDYDYNYIRQVLDIGAAAIKPGVTTDEIDRIVHEAAIERDCYPSPLNYYEFPKSGDIINLDVTLYHDGFHGDLNETYPVGCIDMDSQKLIKTAKECLNKAIECVIEKNAKANNCSVVRTYCGHDNWTAVTEDGKRSAQFEHTLLVTETGVEILTAGKGERRFYPDN
ncbi:1662_t:CDS:2 [Racocetra fulgida]|uniref:1662_t:CDS:1 n=1 Tax=Racocetra fulgida TaxID=60492 RepID=A0A9N9GC77_9GLOM|nr:1662_t:CDS:2 [Racocetra fulgida]